MIIQILNQQAPENAADMIWASHIHGSGRQFQQPKIRFRRQDLARVGTEARGHDAFQEQAGELARSRPPPAH